MQNKYITIILWILHGSVMLLFLWATSFLSLFLPIEHEGPIYVDLGLTNIDYAIYNYIFLSFFFLFQGFMIGKGWSFIRKIGFAIIIVVAYFVLPNIL